VPALEINLK